MVAMEHVSKQLFQIAFQNVTLGLGFRESVVGRCLHLLHASFFHFDSCVRSAPRVICSSN